MVGPIVLLVLLPFTTAVRVEVRNEESPFECPPQCVECCSKMRGIGLVGYRTRDRFKCITRSDDNVTSIPGYECEEPQTRTCNAEETKHTCYFTDAEREAGAWRTLDSCRDTHTSTFQDFVGLTSCSATAIERLIARGTGHHFGVMTAADLIILTDSHALTGGASAYVARHVARDDMLPSGMTRSAVQHDIAERLSSDLESKRLDRYVMGLWATRLKGFAQHNITRASVQPRILRKVEIAGWPARSVSIETREDDMAHIELLGGFWQCAVERMRGVPVEDHMTAHENQWGEGAANPDEVREWFFDRFGAYPMPFHFTVPQNEMSSDRTLEQFVFQNIGAHRIEIIESLDGHNVAFVNPTGLGGCPHDHPVIGCPHPLGSALAAIPERVRRTTKFAVRQEGLFDDVPRRPGLAKWGGNAFFDGEGHLLALQYEGRTLIAEEGGRDWEYFKFVFRSSLLNSITAFDHLVVTHILFAETLAISATENLGPDNELRKFINPHILGTLRVNMKATTALFPTGGMLHRISPFDDEAFVAPNGRDNGILWAKAPVLRYTKFGDVYRIYRRHFEELRSEGVQMPQLPVFDDGILLYQEIQRYVEDSIHLIYGVAECNENLLADHEAQRFIRQFWAMTDAATPDFWPPELRRPNCRAFIDLLAEVIFGVSAFHRHVGTVADFVRDTRFASTVWKEGETNTRPKHAVLTMLLAQSTTTLILPKLSDDMAERIYGDKDLLAGNFRNFSSKMSEIQDQIEHRNQVRQRQNDVPYHQMEPASIEFGVET